MYKTECLSHFEVIKDSFAIIKVDNNNSSALEKFSRAAHTIRGMALQMEDNCVGYLGESLEKLSNEIINKHVKLDNEVIIFMEDMVNSIEKTLDSLHKNEEATIDTNLVKNLDIILSKKHKKV